MKEKAAKAPGKRSIPSVDEILRSDAGTIVEQKSGRDEAVRYAREVIDEIRRDVLAEADRESITGLIESKLLSKLHEAERGRLQRVINATGVIIHTNLGRSPLSKAAVEAIAETASYANVELDLSTGERGRRGESAECLLARICGAEDALIVNNCAAAALLVLSAIAKGGEVVVSRGELVEIGGDFRVPDVLEQSGCRLREVGTTNRTKLSDYERAITAETRAILRVHPSNYRITGFTESPKLNGLAELAHRNELILFEDAGSGVLADLTRFGLGEEPLISSSIEAGADIVSFSGDKLAGGPQAGLIVGKASLIGKLRKHPLYRAVRADKLAYAGIEATLASFARGTAFDEIPTLRMLTMSFKEVDRRAKELAAKIDHLKIDGVTMEIVRGDSAIGGGAGSGVKLETSLIAVRHSSLSANEISAALRRSNPPVVTRINNDVVILDLRTVDEQDEEFVLAAVKTIVPS
jgi:L-seryl-tRNA(Ser) seleniumtransferase